jgi:hypothetical protein
MLTPGGNAMMETRATGARTNRGDDVEVEGSRVLIPTTTASQSFGHDAEHHQQSLTILVSLSAHSRGSSWPLHHVAGGAQRPACASQAPNAPQASLIMSVDSGAYPGLPRRDSSLTTSPHVFRRRIEMAFCQSLPCPDCSSM